MDSRLVIIANRGPRDFVWRNRSWVTRTAAGGLVSMLAPLARQPDVAWWCCVSEPPDARLARSGLYTTAADQADPRLRPLLTADPHAEETLAERAAAEGGQDRLVGAEEDEERDRPRRDEPLGGERKKSHGPHANEAEAKIDHRLQVAADQRRIPAAWRRRSR